MTTSTAIDVSKWEWFGHAGHLIVAYACRFHLCTKVGGFLISTVGEYWPERAVREIHAKVHDPQWLAKNGHLKGDHFDAVYMQRFGFEEIGVGRKYESYVFHVSEDRCTSEECGCGLPVISNLGEVEGIGANHAKEATTNHHILCLKYSQVTPALP